MMNSRIFRFIVGKEVDGNATEFRVHEKALAQLSTPLCNLLKGGLKESQAVCQYVMM